MRILLLGSGGREHAFAYKLVQSPLCSRLFIAPGNPGISALGTCVPISATDFPAIKEFVLTNQIEFVIVGPEAPLVEGIYDYFKNDTQLRSIPVFGPSKMGALLEGSKAYSKAFMLRHQIPTAKYKEFTTENFEEGVHYIQQQQTPIVLKADGLAAGKGVLICNTHAEAQQEFEAMLGGKFGDAGNKVVIEEFMDGIEFSVFVLTNGTEYKILPTAKDYKRIGEGDTGLNTGGMGAVSPVPFVTNEMMQYVEKEIIQPTIQGLAAENIDYFGFIYVGLMWLKTGEIKVVEYNCRMGDPETEAVFPRIKSDLVELFQSTVNHQLSTAEIEIDSRSAVTIILASGGYPEDFVKGKEISGIEAADENAIIFHCGTKLDDGKLLTNGGRVLAVTALAADLQEALTSANGIAEKIQFDGKYFRCDIGYEFKK